MGRVVETLQAITPAMTQVVVQAALAGVNIVYKLARSNGMSLRVLIAYRFIFAAAVVIPIALIVERKDKPKLTWLVVGQAFACGLLGGSLFQNLYGESLVLTSATFVSAIYNIIPAITLVFSLLLGMEKLKLKTRAGKAKIIGIITCTGGAMLLIFYKGKEINIWSTEINILGSQHRNAHQSFSNPVLGTVLALCFCFSFAGNLIIQAKMMKSYPRPYLATAMTLSMGGLQSTVFAFCIERDNWDLWKLGWNTNLIAASYMGIMGSALAFTLMTWGVRARGALFVSVFNPLMLILVAIFASLLIDEKLNVGSVLGGAVIVCGLYVVLWGMGKELKNKNASSVHSILDNLEQPGVQTDHGTKKDLEESVEFSTENLIKKPKETMIGLTQESHYI